LWLPRLCAASAVVVAASACVLFASFGSVAQPWFGATLALANGLALGATARAAFGSLCATWRQLSLLERLLEPLRLVAVVLVAIVVATVLPLIGFLRSACLASGLLALVGLWHTSLHAFLARAPLPRARRWQAAFIGWGVLMGAALVLSERWVSRPQVAYFQGAILHTQKSERSELVVTTGPLGVQVFVNRSLRAADVDRNRYFEALVHPAFGATRTAARVLVLGPGDGFVESEVLAYPEVRTLDVVTEDAALARYAADAPWLAERTRAAMRSARVRVIEAEPIVWLEASHAPYDVIVIDLPDPTGPRWGKNYTRYFFERVRAHLVPGGVVAVQAGSSQGAPRAFANVEATMQSAGLDTHAYHVPVSSIGDWGFVLGGERSFERPTRLRAPTRSLTDAVLRGAFFVPKDSRAEPGAPSTLDDQRVIGLLLHSRPTSPSASP
jgi:spermidine synthase